MHAESPPAGRRWPGFAISAALHAALGLVAVAYPPGLSETPSGVKPLRPSVRVIELALPNSREPLLYRRPALPVLSHAVAGRVRHEDTMRRRETLLQPDVEVINKDEMRLPAVAVLEPVRASRMFVRPPDRPTEVRIPADVLVELAPPQLTGAADGLAERNWGTLENAHLTAPPALRAPIPGSGPATTEERSASAPGTVSEPATIVSIPDRDVPSTRAMAIPPVNRGFGEPPAAATNSALGARAQNGGAAAPERDANLDRAGAEPATVISFPDRDVPSTRAMAIPPVSRGFGEPPAAATNSALGAGAQNGGAAPPERDANLDRAGAASPSIRIERPLEHPPDYVLMQSESAIPGTADLLGCAPVYTVYVPVGTGREWILQYCVPGTSGASGRNRDVVQLGATQPVQAPYAFAIVRPEIRLKPGARFAFVHGVVDASGVFRTLREAGASALVDPAVVLGALQEWQFRAALKDGQAVGVEVLLCIPAP